MTSPRIKSLVKSIVAEDKEFSFDPEKVDFLDIPYKTFAKLLIDNCRKDEKDIKLPEGYVFTQRYIPLFDVPDYLWKSHGAVQHLHKLANTIKIEEYRVYSSYAYLVESPYYVLPRHSMLNIEGIPDIDTPYSIPCIRIFMITTKYNVPMIDIIATEYENMVKSLNDMMWDSVQYAVYLYEKERVDRPKEFVIDFYSKFRWWKYAEKYTHIDVNIYDDLYPPLHISIYGAKQVLGLLIGKKHSRINELKQKLKEKFGELSLEIYEDEGLTKKYVDDRDIDNIPPEAIKLIAELDKILMTLYKKYGYDFDKIRLIIERLHEKEDENYA